MSTHFRDVYCNVGKDHSPRTRIISEEILHRND